MFLVGRVGGVQSVFRGVGAVGLLHGGQSSLHHASAVWSLWSASAGEERQRVSH